MVMSVTAAFNSTAECAAAAAFDRIRVLTVAPAEAPAALPDRPDGALLPRWARASDESAVCGPFFSYFSATAWFFARRASFSPPPSPSPSAQPQLFRHWRVRPLGDASSAPPRGARPPFARPAETCKPPRVFPLE